MKRNHKVLAGAVLVAAILGSSLFTPASVGQPGRGEQEARQFIDLMDNYLGLSNRWVATASEPDTAVYLAIEGITEVYENRGEKAKAIPHLISIVDKSAGNRALRNIARFKLRDLYNETGRSDKALEQLELIIQENSN